MIFGCICTEMHAVTWYVRVLYQTEKRDNVTETTVDVGFCLFVSCSSHRLPSILYLTFFHTPDSWRLLLLIFLLNYFFKFAYSFTISSHFTSVYMALNSRVCSNLSYMCHIFSSLCSNINISSTILASCTLKVWLTAYEERRRRKCSEQAYSSRVNQWPNSCTNKGWPSANYPQRSDDYRCQSSCE